MSDPDWITGGMVFPTVIKPKTPKHLYDHAHELYDLALEAGVVINDLGSEVTLTSAAKKFLLRLAEVVRNCDGETNG